MSDALGLKRGTVELVDYNPEWVVLFDEEKAAIQRVFQERVLGVEHIGSTAIPGMHAKPILDLAVAVESMDGYEQFTPLLEKIGYQFMRDQRGWQGSVLYVKGAEENRTHYLKLGVLDSDFWRDNILFRDYLISHPEKVEEYAKLKRYLFEKHEGVREFYTEDKADFVQSILKLAKEK
jgi:GrpB-like predicted nucleotidyltransferase (UPF0157 family)